MTFADCSLQSANVIHPYCEVVHVPCSVSGFCIISKFHVKSVLVSVR